MFLSATNLIENFVKYDGGRLHIHFALSSAKLIHKVQIARNVMPQDD